MSLQCLTSPQEEALRLLGLVGADLALPGPLAEHCAVLDWARWGLTALSGPVDGPPSAPVVPVAARVRGLLAALEALTGRYGTAVRLDPGQLLAGRARLHGWTRGGRQSANGTSRLIRARDGWLAVSLARPDDLEALPAALGHPFDGSPWAALAAADRPAGELAARLQLLGIPAAELGASAGLAPLLVTTLGRPGGSGSRDLVLDLSALWAGPLCASVLGRAGAQVIKVEDVHRPDGARFGPAAFYDELHAGQLSRTLDFATDRDELLRLAERADLVIESSRPRALRGLGLVAEDWLRHRPGRTWVSITGYGRDDPGQRVAFGDDAAVAGGLVADGPAFCGDALADPLTGLYAALAALASRIGGGGQLVEVRMAGVSADVHRPAPGIERPHPVTAVDGGWTVAHGSQTVGIEPRAAAV